MYSQSVKNMVNNRDMWLTSEGSLVGLGPLPVAFNAISRKIMSEMSCIFRQPAGVRELLVVVVKPRHTHTQELDSGTLFTIHLKFMQVSVYK